MTVTAWRISKPKYAATAFTGEGPRRYGGRWNSPGVPMIYTAGSISLASLEMLVHLQSSEILKKYVLHEVCFSRSFVQTLAPKKLPKNWRSSPAPRWVQEIGDHWAARLESAVLEVPSAIVEGEFNYLINPRHSDFIKIVVADGRRFKFDPRLAE